MSGVNFRSGLTNAKLQSLDALCSNVMIADINLNITYMNKSLMKLLQEAEGELRQEMPQFSVSKLIGSNIDIFHKKPTHQRQMLAEIQDSHFATIQVGKRYFDLTVIPLKKGSKRTGIAVEWADAKERLLNLDYTAQIAAIGRFQAVVEFSPDGKVLAANANFLSVMGYRLEEIQGREHSIFVEPADRESVEYGQFWDKLRQGKYQSAEFKRVGKDGSVIWIQGSYNPILGQNGKVIKIVKFAVDVTPRLQSVTDIGAALTGLAEGNLESRIDRPLIPELDKLRTDFNRALETLQDTMRRVSASSATIKGGTEEIRVSSDDLCRRTEQQAASLEETAAALDQITATVKKTSEGSIHARAVVASAKADAEHSGNVVDQAAQAMSAIEQSAQKVSQIIGVIDEIAFQTNLLALNAGVEAARAGEAGRGFAVVASEVRALAQRSAEAAKEIKALISTSSQQVSVGVGLVRETGEALKRIVEKVLEINTVVLDIATSTQEQSTALQEVNTAVNQMDQMTQQNAAMVEETTAASHALATETEELTRLVGQFEVGSGTSSAIARKQPESVRPPRPTRRVSTAIALKTAGRGGAARKAAPSSETEWQDF